MTTSTDGVSKRIAHVLEILEAVRRRQPESLEDLVDVRNAAVRESAAKWGINESTIRDKPYRGLELGSAQKFDELVFTWLTKGDATLQQTMEQHASTRSRVEDIKAIRMFFNGNPISAPSVPGQANTTPDHVPEYSIWLFQTKPTRLNLSEAISSIKEGDEGDWGVTNYRESMRSGDVVLLWQSGPDAGIYAIGELAGEPLKKDGEDAWSVRYRYTKLLAKPIPKPVLLQHPVLQGMTVITAPHGTNFRVTREQYEALQSLISPNGHSIREARPQYESYVPPSFEEIYESVLDQGLRIDERQLRRYHLSLRNRGFVILSGVSGTGKSWLAEAYAKAAKAKHKLVPVAPNWTTNEDLLGYVNPLREEQYCDTDFSLFLREAAKEYETTAAGSTPRPYHLILDEMNLARVEYYFAKFLSAMEIRARHGVGQIELEPGKCTLLPPNLFFIGTVNVDETTHGFADKVYDRAQLIELQASRDSLAQHLADAPYCEVLMAIWDAVHEVAPFAYRVVDEIKTYITHAEAMGTPWGDAMDEQLLQKVLPKVKGADPRVGKALQDFITIAENRFELSHAKAVRMLEGFTQHEFASYF